MSSKTRKRKRVRRAEETVTVGVVGLTGEGGTADPAGEYIVRVVETKVFDVIVDCENRAQAETIAGIESGFNRFFRTVEPTRRSAEVVSFIKPV